MTRSRTANRTSDHPIGHGRKPLTQLEFRPVDHRLAEALARKLGYAQTVYTTTSDLWGLFCLPENPATAKPGEATWPGCIIRTEELGLLFVQDLEDVRAEYLLKMHGRAI